MLQAIGLGPTGGVDAARFRTSFRTVIVAQTINGRSIRSSIDKNLLLRSFLKILIILRNNFMLKLIVILIYLPVKWHQNKDIIDL